MLSNVDMKHILGKYIGIYPFNPERIEGASIDLTASCYAWSLKKKGLIVNEGIIKIEPNDTAIIFTNEFISLDKSYAGACYNRISFSVRGINHSSSPLKPGYTGRLSVSFHNDSSENFEIAVGAPIVVVMLHKLHRVASETFGNGRGSRLDMLSSLGIQIDAGTREELQRYDDRRRLLERMKNDDDFKKYKKKVLLKKGIFLIITLVIILIIASVVLIYSGRAIELLLGIITVIATVILTNISSQYL